MSKPVWTLPVTLPDNGSTYTVTAKVNTTRLARQCSISVANLSVPIDVTLAPATKSGLAAGTVNVVLSCTNDFGFTQRGCYGAQPNMNGHRVIDDQKLTLSINVSSP
jgi:hypothetical protein